MRQSIIFTVSKEEFQKIVDNSSSILDIMKFFNLSLKGSGTYKTIYRRIKQDSIDLQKFKNNVLNLRKNILSSLHKKATIPIEELLVEGKSKNNCNLKKRLIQSGLIENKCSICGNNGFWMGSPISLDLDHVNGNHEDNTLSNLRILCPNCHRQTKNFGSKNSRQIKIERPIKVKKVRDIKTKFIVSKEELQNLIEKYPLTKIGKMFNVSDNAIKKRCKKLDIDLSVSPFRKNKTGA